MFIVDNLLLASIYSFVKRIRCVVQAIEVHLFVNFASVNTDKFILYEDSSYMITNSAALKV